MADDACTYNGVGPNCTDKKWERAESEQRTCLMNAKFTCMSLLDDCASGALDRWTRGCRDNPFGNGMLDEVWCLNETYCDAEWSACYCESGGLRCTSCWGNPGPCDDNNPPDGSNSNTNNIILKNAGVTTSAFDLPIPIIKGRSIVAGNIIWIGNQRSETVTTTVVENNNTTVTTREYGFIDMAIGLSEGELERISRIWIDGNLIVNGLVPVTDDRDVPLNRALYNLGLNVVFYSGSEAQQPDSVLITDKGAELSPAHRGLCYVMFRSYPIVNVTGSLPQVRIELIEEIDVDASTGDESALAFTPHDDMLASDPVSGLIFVTDGTDIMAVTMDDLELELTLAITGSPIVPATAFLTVDGNLCFRRSDGTLSFLNPADPAELITSVATVDAGGTSDAIRIYDTDSLEAFDVLCIATGAKIYLFQVTREPTGVITLLNTYTGVTSSSLTRVLAVAGSEDSLTVKRGFYAFAQEGSNLAIYTGTLTDYANGSAFDPTRALVQTLIASTAWGASGAFTLHDAIYDPVDHSLVVFVTNSGVHYIFKVLIEGMTVAWSTTVAELPTSYKASRRVRIEQQEEYGYLVGTTEYVVALTTGVITSKTTGSPTQAGAQFYDAILRQVYYKSSGNEIAKSFADRIVAEAVTAGDIAKRIMLAVGISPENIDVSDAQTASCDGFIMSENTGQDYLQALCDFFGMFVIESAGRLTARLKSEVVAFTVNEDTGMWHDVVESKRIRETFIDAMTVHYYDTASDGVIDEQTIARDVFEPETDFVLDSNPQSYSVPIWTTATKARLAAERLLLMVAQQEQETTIFLGPAFLAIEPGDFIVLADDSTTQRRSREVMLDTTLELQIRARIDAADIYDSVPPIVGVQRTTTDPMLRDSVPRITNYPVAFNLPPINTPTTPYVGAITLERIYVGQQNPTDGVFAPTEMWVKGETTTYRSVGTPTREPIWGFVVTPPNDTTTPFTTDRASTLVVEFNKELPVDTIESLANITDLYECDYCNSIWIGQEIIQFQTASIAMDNKTVTFTTLFRGRWGTDRASNGHVAGEVAVFHDEASLLSPPVPSDAARGGPITVALIDDNFPTVAKSTSLYYNIKTNRVWKPTNIRRRDVDYVLDFFTAGIYLSYEPRTPYINTFKDTMVGYQPYNTMTNAFTLVSAYDASTFATARDAEGWAVDEENAVSTNAYIIREFTEPQSFGAQGRYFQYFIKDMLTDTMDYGDYLSVAFVIKHVQSDDEVIIAAEFPAGDDSVRYFTYRDYPIHGLDVDGFDTGVAGDIVTHMSQGYDTV